jgi:hypothetical protein
MAAFLQAISAGDLGIAVEGEDFVAVQSMRERYRQEVSYRGSFGQAHPNIRTKRSADENTVSFSFLLLKSGIEKGLNDYRKLRDLSDFSITTTKGTKTETYLGCNWTDIDIDSGLDQVMVNVDVTIPGFPNV